MPVVAINLYKDMSKTTSEVNLNEGQSQQSRRKGLQDPYGCYGMNALVGIAEKVNLWNSKEKMNRRRWTEKCKTESKANTKRVHKHDEVLEEDTRRTIIVGSSERITATSRQAMTLAEKKVKRKKKDDFVFVETESK
ncbi:hypothetical protein Bca4012_058845 [Brassica carinata]